MEYLGMEYLWNLYGEDTIGQMHQDQRMKNEADGRYSSRTSCCDTYDQQRHYV